MRINVYSQELTDEVIKVEKISNTGRVYSAVQLILHSSSYLHHPPKDDDRSAVTFWMPNSAKRNRDMANAFHKMANLFYVESERIRQSQFTDSPVQETDN